MIRRAVLALLLSSAGPALAEDLQLAFPLDCSLGQDCHIQQYMDRDPSPEARDYRCAGLTYDGHKGTDFALPSTAAMHSGVTVRAAAAGVVKGRRDGMADGAPLDAVQGRECGNGIVIDHGGGWESQYCHLKQGSVSVSEGQQVASGETVGQVGQSGKAAFPHLHLSLRRNGAPVDPFDPASDGSCGAAPTQSLWQDALPYRPGGLITVGFADQIPDYAAIKAGTADRRALPTNAPALVVFGFSYGTRGGDILRLRLTGPEGEVIEQDVVMGKSQAQSFRAIGKKRRGKAWPAGAYEGSAALLRDGDVIDSRRATLTLR